MPPKETNKMASLLEKVMVGVVSGNIFHLPFPRKTKHRHGTGVQMGKSSASPVCTAKTTVEFSLLNETKFVRRYHIFY